jgi:glycosyltransferase involved in cell wall biosynthesis
MACGRPVISSGTGGAQEILTLGDFALTFTPNDARSLASAIITLAKDSSLRARFGQNGLTVARAHFGRNRLASELLPIYENFLSRENLAVGTSAHEVAM